MVGFCFVCSVHLFFPSTVTNPDTSLNYSPNGYIVDFRGNYMSNRQHNDAKILRYMVKQNVRGLCEVIDPTEWMFELDRGFAKLYDDDDFKYDFIMPTLNRSKPVSCVEANISRLQTRTRFSNEKVYGDLEETYPILAKQVIGKWKLYFNSWSENLAGFQNYRRPQGAVINTNDCYENYIRWCIATKFFRHPMRQIVDELNLRTESSNGRW